MLEKEQNKGARKELIVSFVVFSQILKSVERWMWFTSQKGRHTQKKISENGKSVHTGEKNIEEWNVLCDYYNILTQNNGSSKNTLMLRKNNDL